MGYSQFVLRGPYFWIWLSALGTALTLINTLRYLRARRANKRVGSERYVIRCLLGLSAAVGCAAAAVIFSDPQRIMDIGLLYFFLLIAGFTTVSVLFPLTVGLPLTIVGLTPLIFTAIAGATLIPLRSSEPPGDIVGRINIVSAINEQIMLELHLGTRSQPILLTLQGEYLAVEGSLVQYSGGLFFMGANAGFRLQSITAMAAGTETDRYDYNPTNSLVEQLQRLFITIAGPLPGIAHESLRSMPTRPAIIDSFEIVVDGNGARVLPTLSLTSGRLRGNGQQATASFPATRQPEIAPQHTPAQF